MEQIRTRLEKGESPQELIKSGLKRTTVYSVAKKVKGNLKETNNDDLKDRDIFFICLIREVLAYIAPDGDPDEALAACIEVASIAFEETVGRKPPEDFLPPRFKKPEQT